MKTFITASAGFKLPSEGAKPKPGEASEAIASAVANSIAEALGPLVRVLAANAAPGPAPRKRFGISGFKLPKED